MWSLRKWLVRSRSNRVLRARLHSEYSKLTWNLETQAKIEACARRYDFGAAGRVVVYATPAPTVQIKVFTDERLPFELGGKRLAPEHPASLVYSRQVNGAIAVMLNGHSPPAASSSSYIIGYAEDSRRMAGDAGAALIRGHLRDLGRLSQATRAYSIANRSSGRFLARLARTNEKFSFVFSSQDEARRYRINQESSFTIGLVGGLVTSSIVPFVFEFGKQQRQKAEATLQRCGTGIGAANCRNADGYEMAKRIGDALDISYILLALLAFVVYAAAKLRRNVLQR